MTPTHPRFSLHPRVSGPDGGRENLGYLGMRA